MEASTKKNFGLLNFFCVFSSLVEIFSLRPKFFFLEILVFIHIIRCIMTSGVVKIDPFDSILHILRVISIFNLVNIDLRDDHKLAITLPIFGF